MTARKPAARKTTAPVKLSGELVEVPSEALATEAAAAASVAQDVEAPADEVADAIAELEADTHSTPKAPAKKTVKVPVPTAHTNCTHAKKGAEGKKARAACRRAMAAESAKAAKA